MNATEKRLAEIKAKWEKKFSSTATRTVRIRTKVTEIKKCKEFTKVKVVGDDFQDKWNDKTPKMYFKGFVRKAIV